MTSARPGPIHFGPFEVTKQVFLTTAHSFALVNLKPLLPGHVLVCTAQPHKRLTDLSAAELTDLFGAVQRVQHMLARHFFFVRGSGSGSADPDPGPASGSFNIALQDGVDAGQTVPHVHVHVIPRIPGSTAVDGPVDAVYEGMAAELGNVGGALWDREAAAAGTLGPRPRPGGSFPKIEDADRRARSMEEMEAEAGVYREVLREMEGVRGEGRGGDS